MRRLALTLLAATALCAHAGDDFGLWTELSATKDFKKKFSLDGGFEFRQENNLRTPTRWAASVGGSYKPCSFLKLGAGYNFLYDRSLQEAEVDYKTNSTTGESTMNGYNVDHGYWRRKHRLTFDVTGKVSAGRFTFALRERYQYTHSMPATTLRTRYRGLLPAEMEEGYTGDKYYYNGTCFTRYEVASKDKRAKDKHYLRSRLSIEYNIKHCPFTPFVSAEVSNDLGHELTADKWRYSVGGEWKISKQHRLEVAYLYEDGTDDDTGGDAHILTLGYKFKF